MTIQVETVDIIEVWLYSTLTSDATMTSLVAGRVSSEGYPAELAFPNVTFGFVSSRDVRGVGGALLDTSNLYTVKAVGKNIASFSTLKPIATRINELLSVKNVTLPGGANLGCMRDGIVQYPEVWEGVQYRHLGGTYRIWASKD